MKYKNRLAQAGSPYLQQHADNPVDWYEWGTEALQKAKKENKPLIISIGYSACHWCHVMAHESYENEEVAAVMNAHFVSIKVDREERPDLDQLYIDAAQLLNGHAGWPLNVFALPDGRPFYIGTYFPRKQWKSVMMQLAEIYKNEPKKVEEQAVALTNGVQREFLLEGHDAAKKPVREKEIKTMAAAWYAKIDKEKGGLKGTQKFPMPVSWEFLLEYAGWSADQKIGEALELTLTAMARGGIYDQLGGGFSRYTTDENWRIPHFEKMVYDNAQLVSLYAKALRQKKNSLYEEVIRSTLNFVNRELTDANGGFYTALNADSEGEEGKYYTWEKAVIENALPREQASLLMEYYGVIPEGNWEKGKNILYRPQSLQEFAAAHQLSPEACAQRLKASGKKLLSLRGKRKRPSTDDKILTGWNALMLKAFLEAYKSLGTLSYLETALKNATFLDENLRTEKGQLFRSYKDGKAGIPGFLDDYAFLAEAFCDLYEVTFAVKWLRKAKALVQTAIAHFYEEASGLFYYTAEETDKLFARKKELIDNTTPSSNAVMAAVLYRLGHYFEDPHWLEMAARMLDKMKENTLKRGPYFGRWGKLLLQTVNPVFEVVIMGRDAREKTRDLQKRMTSGALWMGGREENLPLMKNKGKPGKTLIYICRNKVCGAPTESVEQAWQQLKKRAK